MAQKTVVSTAGGTELLTGVLNGCIIQNLGAVAIEVTIGPGSPVIGQGVQVAASGGVLTLDLAERNMNKRIAAIAASSTADVRVLSW